MESETTKNRLLGPALDKELQQEFYRLIVFLEQGRLPRGAGATVNVLNTKIHFLCQQIRNSIGQKTIHQRPELREKAFTMMLVCSDIWAALKEYDEKIKHKAFNTRLMDFFTGLSCVHSGERVLASLWEQLGW